MKTLLKTLFLCLLLFSLSCAQKLTAGNRKAFSNPKCVGSNTTLISIAHVEFSDTATIISFRAAPGSSLRIAKASYLLGEKGRKYKALRGEGIILGEFINAPQEGETLFKVLFEPMPRKTRFFDFAEGQAYGDFRIYGVHEEGKGPKVPRKRDTFVMTPELENEFFRADTACVKGRIEGYSRSRGYSTLLFTNSNAMTGEDKPVAVDISEDGSFELRFLAYHPTDGNLAAKSDNNYKWIHFYVVPGQTTELTIRPDWTVTYTSVPSGPFSCKNSLEHDYSDCCNYSYMEYYNDTQSHDTGTFADNAMQKMQRSLDLADYLARRFDYTPWERHLANCYTRMEYGEKALMYLLDQRHNITPGMTQEEYDEKMQTLSNPSVYLFMRDMPHNDVSCLAINNFDTFMNRYEFTPVIRYSGGLVSLTDAADQARADSTTMAKDMSVTGADKPSFFGQMILLRALRHDLDHLSGRASMVDSIYANRLTYLTREAMRTQAGLMKEKARLRSSLTYPLPDSKGAAILRRLTEKYRGKYLMIDFWGLSCGPCRSGIELSRQLRESLRQNPDIDFLFISSKDDGTDEAHQKYVSEHLEGEDVVRVNRDEYNHLMQLFNFLGIPHYETLDRKGNVLRNSLDFYIPEQFMDSFKRIKSGLED